MLSAEPHRENPEVSRRGSYGRVLYNYFRYYDPTVGRYISADPIGQAGGTNLYSYVFNNPLNLIDAFGLATPQDVADAISYVNSNHPGGASSIPDSRNVYLESFAGTGNEGSAGYYDPSDDSIHLDNSTTSMTSLVETLVHENEHAENESRFQMHCQDIADAISDFFGITEPGEGPDDHVSEGEIHQAIRETAEKAGAEYRRSDETKATRDHPLHHRHGIDPSHAGPFPPHPRVR